MYEVYLWIIEIHTFIHSFITRVRRVTGACPSYLWVGFITKLTYTYKQSLSHSHLWTISTNRLTSMYVWKYNKQETVIRQTLKCKYFTTVSGALLIKLSYKHKFYRFFLTPQSNEIRKGQITPRREVISYHSVYISSGYNFFLFLFLFLQQAIHRPFIFQFNFKPNYM